MLKKFTVRTACFIFAIATTVLWALTITGYSKPPAKAGIQWQQNATSLLRDPSAHSKPLLLRFTASWCGPCKAMNAQVWPHPDVVKAVNAAYVPVEIDIDTPGADKLAEQYQILGVPTIIALDREGKEVNRANYMDSKGTVRFLKKSAR